MPRLDVPIGPNGPIIEVRLWVRREDAANFAAAGLPVPRPFSVPGLVDTGARVTAIQQSLAEWMGVSVAGVLEARSSVLGNEARTAPVYRIPMTFGPLEAPAPPKWRTIDAVGVQDECLRLCESSYLLIPAGAKPGDAVAVLSHEVDAPVREPVSTRLGHDTLAPLVRERFRASMDRGQRARHLLENRALERKDGAKGHHLDRPDLETVERGLAGMRRPTDDERRLIEVSRRARVQLVKAEARNKRAWRLAQISFAGLILILAGVIRSGPCAPRQPPRTKRPRF